MRRSPQCGQVLGGGARDWTPPVGESHHVCRLAAVRLGPWLSAGAKVGIMAGSAKEPSRSVSDSRDWALVATRPRARRSRASRFSLTLRSGFSGRDSGALVWTASPFQGVAFATADSHKRTAAKQRPGTRRFWAVRNVDDLDMPVIYHAFVPAGNGAFRADGGRGRSPVPAGANEREPEISGVCFLASWREWHYVCAASSRLTATENDHERE